jgi:hypothetical protein
MSPGIPCSALTLPSLPQSLTQVLITGLQGINDLVGFQMTVLNVMEHPRTTLPMLPASGIWN